MIIRMAKAVPMLSAKSVSVGASTRFMYNTTKIHPHSKAYVYIYLLPLRFPY